MKIKISENLLILYKKQGGFFRYNLIKIFKISEKIGLSGFEIFCSRNFLSSGF